MIIPVKFGDNPPSGLGMDESSKFSKIPGL